MPRMFLAAGGVIVVRRLAILSLAAALTLAGTPAYTDNLPSQTDADWRERMVVSSDAAQQLLTYAVVVSRPLADNSIIVPWLEDNKSHLASMFIFELARRLFDGNHGRALEWFVIAQLRLRYDMRRCTDPSIGGDVLAVGYLEKRFGNSMAEYANAHKDDYLAALTRVQVQSDFLDSDASPDWVCGGGLAAFAPKLGLKTNEQRERVRPQSDWPNIKATVHRDLVQSVDQLRRAIAAAQILSSYAPPTRVPEAVLSGSTEDKVKAIGDEARAALQTLTDPWHLASQLLKLAALQLDAGDKAGARQTLDGAQSSIEQLSGFMGMGYRNDAISLWVRAGDKVRASALVESDGGSARERIYVLGRFGVALAKYGDAAGARALLDRIAQAASAIEAAEENDPAMQEAADQLGGPPRHVPFRDIGTALIDAGDVDGALDVAGRLPAGSFFRADLLIDIASKQCAAREPGAHATLQAAEAATRAIKSRWFGQARNDLVYALAYCDDVERALTLTRELAPSHVDGVLEGVATRLTDHHDYAHAIEIDRALAPIVHGSYSVIAFAGRQLARGNVAAATANLAAVSAEIRKTAPTPIEPKHEAIDQRLTSIIRLQIKAGAFADALVSAEPYERDNRTGFIVQIIEEEAKRHDADALSKTLPLAIQKIQEAHRETAAGALTAVAMSLARAGYVEQARESLALLQELGRQGIGGFYPYNVFRFIAQVHVALGDIAAARASLDSIEPRDRALPLLDVARQICEAHEFASALAIAEQIQPPARNGAFVHIAGCQAKASDISGAMITAWQVNEPRARTEAMFEILDTLRRS